MKCYLAPMEGVTGYIFRNAYHEIFYKMDKYFTPFLVPNQNQKLKSKDFNDIRPEHNIGLNIVPQILTNSDNDFIWISNVIKEFGYQEVNLNLGCPSKTVVTKGRGSGFLAKKEELKYFLDHIFSKVDIDISIKTRLGKENRKEFYELLDLYNQYPLKELIIHPRIQTDFYKNHPDYEMFGYALKNSKNTLCYNGDLFTTTDYQKFCNQFESVDTIMMGRGIVSNPALLNEMFYEKKLDKKQLKEFHDKICTGYQEVMSGDHNVLFKMKEVWSYMEHIFTNSAKYIKKIKKTQNLNDYKMIVKILFEEQEIM